MSRFDRIPSTMGEVRNNYRQQQVRDQSTSIHLNKKHVTHYFGLEVAVTLNRRLPGFAQRTDDELKAILNTRANLELHMASTNQNLHKRMDKRLMDRDDDGPLTNEEYQRLVQITKAVQSDEFQDAVIEHKDGFKASERAGNRFSVRE